MIVLTGCDLQSVLEANFLSSKFFVLPPLLFFLSSNYHSLSLADRLLMLWKRQMIHLPEYFSDGRWRSTGCLVQLWVELKEYHLVEMLAPHLAGAKVDWSVVMKVGRMVGLKGILMTGLTDWLDQSAYRRLCRRLTTRLAARESGGLWRRHGTRLAGSIPKVVPSERQSVDEMVASSADP